MKNLIALLIVVGCCAAAIPVQAAESQDQVLSQSDGIIAGMADPLWAQADEYFHHGDYPRICDLDRVIVGIDPKFTEVYATGGWLMESLGRYSDAEAFYQQGVFNNPLSSSMYYSLGMFYYNTIHDYDAALAVYQEDVNKAPNADVNDWKMLAHTYERLRNMKMAVSTWQQIKSRWPNGPAVQVNLNRILHEQSAAAATTSDGAPHTPE